MATATLELVNPYSKFGLKRRPTYDEIIGLFSENETLTGQLPDRRATQFKSSQEGSFFDGLDHLEILKEQQQRISERQMRELMMRQNLGGSTFSIERLNQQLRERVQPEAEVQQDTGLNEASIQAQLQERARQAVERQQQTGEAHRQGGFLSGRTTPIIEGIFNTLSPLSRGGFSPLVRTDSRDVPPLQMPSPQQPRQQPEVINIASESEAEMLTAREDVPTFTDKKQETIYYSLRAGNPDALIDQLDEAYQVF